MKKLLLLLLLAILSLPIYARDFVYTYEGHTLKYIVVNEDDKTCELLGFKTYDNNDELIIPSVANDGYFDYSVVSIGDNAFTDVRTFTSVTIPNSVTTIGEYAFGGCYSLTSVIIPNSIISIGNGAFHKCYNLPSITIPNSVTSIGNDAFIGCSGLTSLTIPNSVTSIGNGAFSDCYSLTSVIIPNSVISIGDNAFSYCSDLTDIYYNAVNPIDGPSEIFMDDTYTKATLFVPAEAIEKCKAIDPWKNFKNINAFDFSGVEGVFDDNANPDIDFSSPLEVYTLNGVRIVNSINNLAPDLYIIRQGIRSKKVAIK